MKRSSFVRLGLRACFAVALATCAAGTQAQQPQSFPPGPVTLICPYAPGTGIDIMARIVAQELGKTWPHAVVVKNQPGASGNIGAMAAAGAKPDGTTLLIMANSHLINQYVSKNVVDAQTALTAVAPAGEVPYLLTVSSSLPVHSVAELVALAKAKPGEINYSGIYGSVPHLLGVALASAGKIDIKFISYKSTTDAMVDTISGRVPIWFTTVASAMPLIQAGTVRPLAVTGKERLKLLADVPTAAEAGYPSLDSGAAFYFMAPAGTPKDVVEKINRDITAAMKAPEVIEKLAVQGAEANTSTPQELTRLLKDESARWGELVQASGIKAD